MGTVAGTSPSQGQVVRSPLVENFVIADANTEYTIPIRSGTKRYSIRARPAAVLKVTYTEGESDDIYKTIPAGCNDEQDRLDPAVSLTLYLQSPKPNLIIELETWL